MLPSVLALLGQNVLQFLGIGAFSGAVPPGSHNLRHIMRLFNQQTFYEWESQVKTLQSISLKKMPIRIVHMCIVLILNPIRSYCFSSRLKWSTDICTSWIQRLTIVKDSAMVFLFECIEMLTWKSLEQLDCGMTGKSIAEDNYNILLVVSVRFMASLLLLSWSVF